MKHVVALDLGLLPWPLASLSGRQTAGGAAASPSLSSFPLLLIESMPFAAWTNGRGRTDKKRDPAFLPLPFPVPLPTSFGLRSSLLRNYGRKRCTNGESHTHTRSQFVGAALMGSSKVALAEPLLYFLSLTTTRKKTRKRGGREHVQPG